MRNFEEVWEDIRHIPGWLLKDEAKLLYEAAQRCAKPYPMLEIGTYQGRSTTLLAEAGQHVYAIDPLSEKTLQQIKTPTKPAEELTVSLEKRFSKLLNVQWMREHSTKVTIPFKNISLLYIDGDHKWPAPLIDFLIYKRSLHPDCLILFHDYGSRKGVTRSVRLLVRARQLTIEAKASKMVLCRQSS